jgi:hypothetical protein
MTGMIDLAAIKARPRVRLAIDLARKANLAPAECSPALFDPNRAIAPDPTLVGVCDLALHLVALVDAVAAEPDPAKALATLRTRSEQLLGPFPATAA